MAKIACRFSKRDTGFSAAQLFAAVLILAASFAFNSLFCNVAKAETAPPTVLASVSAAERLNSMRLTYAIFSGVLEEYIRNGRTEYRPDFLLHERYIRTFLTSWNLMLNSGEAKSTEDIWNHLFLRKSYLGKNEIIWKRLLPSHFDLGTSDRPIRIGNRRETFLSVILREEKTLNLEARTSRILSYVQRDLIPDDSDLAIAILNAYAQHPDVRIQEMAKRTIESLPRYSATLQALSFARSLALGTAVAPEKIATGLSFGVQAAAKFKAANMKRLQAIWNRAKPSPNMKSVAASVALHGALGTAIIVNEKNKAGSKPTTPQSPSSAEKSPISRANALADLVSALTYNLASTEPSHIAFQVDEAILDTPDPETDKSQWAQQGRLALKDWRFNTRLPKNFKIGAFILEGERFLDVWPKNTVLARQSLKIRLAQAERRLIRQSPATVEDLRKILVPTEIGDYRGERSSLTSVLLDWGGNCTSQTSIIVSLLQSQPQFLPRGAKLLIFSSPTHLEPVILHEGKIHFLVAGKIFEKTEGMTLLYPEALIHFALHANGFTSEIPSDFFYYTGKPGLKDRESGSWLEKFTAMGSIIRNFGMANEGIFKSASTLKALGSRVMPDIPKHAKIQYSPSRISSEAPEYAWTAALRNESWTDRRGSTEIDTGSAYPYGEKEIRISFGGLNIDDSGKTVLADPSLAPSARPTPGNDCKLSYPMTIDCYLFYQAKLFTASNDKNHNDSGTFAIRLGSFRIQSNSNDLKRLSPRGDEHQLNFWDGQELWIMMDRENFNQSRALPRELWLHHLTRKIDATLATTRNLITEADLDRVSKLDFTGADPRVFAELTDFSLSTIPLTGIYNISAFTALLTGTYPDVAAQVLSGVSGEASSLEREYDWFGLAAKAYEERWLKQYAKRADLIARFQPLKFDSLFRWTRYIGLIRETATKNPRLFLQSFETAPSYVKLALLKMMEKDRTLFIAVVDELDRLSLKDIAWAPENDLHSGVDLPTCSGQGCEGGLFYVIPNTAKTRGNRQAPATDSSANPIYISPGNLADITLLTKGHGAQLWDESVIENIESRSCSQIDLLNLGAIAVRFSDASKTPRPEPEILKRLSLKFQSCRASKTK